MRVDLSLLPVTLRVVPNIYSSICEVLKDLGKDNSDRDCKDEAIRILRLLKSFDFVFCLYFMVDILGFGSHISFEYNITKKRSRYRKCHELSKFKMEPLLENVTLFCDKHDVIIVNMEDEYYNGFSRRRGSQVNNLHHYHVDVFKTVIDMQLQELNHRFNEANTKLLLCMACLCPRESFKAFDLDKLMEMTTLYREDFRTEYDLQVLEVELKNYVKDVREDEIFNQLKNIGELAKKMVYILLKLALILPVATTSVERIFSAMKLVKTDVRNKMGDQFLSDRSISNDTIVKLYQAIKLRQIQL
uniref:HAT C-terminal dimerisation domain-containing protein n=1 Tax=Lactuca sativa TaxID=4236 RepID=A0A9R1V6G7_LACSA|nr:hypothetical protein LSAT_V11C600302880 [Lactuca sativa]